MIPRVDAKMPNPLHALLVSILVSTVGCAPDKVATPGSRLPTAAGLRFEAIADARVSRAYPQKNYGSSTFLRVRRGTWATYLKFRVTGVGSAAAAAKLRLFANNGSPDGGQVFLVGNDWEEETINWNNAPTLTSHRVKEIGRVANNSEIEIDLGALIEGDGDYSLAIVSESSNSAFYSSREGSTSPLLLLTSADSSSPALDTALAPLSDAGAAQQRDAAVTPEPDWGAEAQEDSAASPPPPPPPPTGKGIWISRAEIMALPTSGAAWKALKSAADNIPAAVGGHTSNHDVHTLAAALVAARLGDSAYYEKTANNLIAAIGTEDDGNSLSIARNLAAYVIAADVIDFAGYDATREARFRAWASGLLSYQHPAGGGCSQSKGTCSIIGKHEDRPNNHGTMAGASRLATALYLGDDEQVERIASVLHGYLGNRAAYAGFSYGDLSWQCDPSKPVGINAKGCTKGGLSLDGALPDDQRRCGGFSNPPCSTGYAWEGLQGVVVQAYMLHRRGYPTFQWEDSAILRAVKWLHGPGGNPATGDDRYQLPILDRVYGTRYWDGATVGRGKNMGWTDWTHDS